MAVVVGLCLVARSALWADTLKSRLRLNGEDSVVLLSTYENEPLVLAETLFSMSEKERIINEESSYSKALFALASAVKKSVSLEPKTASRTRPPGG